MRYENVRRIATSPHQCYAERKHVKRPINERKKKEMYLHLLKRDPRLMPRMACVEVDACPEIFSLKACRGLIPYFH
jgi:hypothetical protein